MNNLNTISLEVSAPSEPVFSLDELGLRDDRPKAVFDPITKLVARWFNTADAFVTIVDDEPREATSPSGESMIAVETLRRCAPEYRSLCGCVKTRNAPLAVNNSSTDPMIKEHPGMVKNGVVAYLGVPIALPDGSPIGALCVIDGRPRAWSRDDIKVLSDFAQCVNDEIRLRAAMLANEKAHREKMRQFRLRENLVRSFTTPGMKVEDRFTAVLKEACDVFGMAVGRIVKQEGGRIRPLFQHHDSGFVLHQECEDRLELLTRRVFSECDPLMVHDFSAAPHLTRTGTMEEGYGSYLGAPLVLDGTLYGALEFCSPVARAKPWSDTEASYLSAASLVVTSNLGIFGQINMLRKSEAALLAHISQIGAR